MAVLLYTPTHFKLPKSWKLWKSFENILLKKCGKPQVSLSCNGNHPKRKRYADWYCSSSLCCLIGHSVDSSWREYEVSIISCTLTDRMSFVRRCWLLLHSNSTWGLMIDKGDHVHSFHIWRNFRNLCRYAPAAGFMQAYCKGQDCFEASKGGIQS